VTGAGPLLHRVVMAAAERVPPGVLMSPGEAGAVPAAVCRLSGMKVSPKCAQLTEWFKPGTEPAVVDTWERDGRKVLPAVYAAWTAAGAEADEPSEEPTRSVQATEMSLADRLRDGRNRPARTDFRILSPQDGDRYSVRPGADPRFATIGLRASSGDAVRWIVDGAPHDGPRWRLVRGNHTIEAVLPDGRTATVRVIVE
jgi:hypothetical protein